MEWNDRRGLGRSWVERGTGGAPELPRWLMAGTESALDIRSRPPALSLSQYGLTPDAVSDFPHLASTVYPSDASLYGGLGLQDRGRYLLLNSETPAVAGSAVPASYLPSSTLTPGVSGLLPSGLELNRPLLSSHSNGLLASNDYLASHSMLLNPHQFASLERREEPLTRLGDYIPLSSLPAPLLDREHDRYTELLLRSGLSDRSLLPLKRSRYSPPRLRSPPRRGTSPPRKGSSPARNRSPRKKFLPRVADKGKKVESKDQGQNKDVEAKKQDKDKEIDAQKQGKGKEVEVPKQDGASAATEVTENVTIDKQISPIDASCKGAGIDKPTVENPLAGMIFGCTNATEQECRRLQLFGLPPAKKNDVLQVVPGTKLFLYNFDSKELSGIYEATSYGAVDIIPHAFKTLGSFPAQVRTKRIIKAPNLPLKVFKEAIKENFYSFLKFKYELNASQVEKLVALFSSPNVKATTA